VVTLTEKLTLLLASETGLSSSTTEPKGSRVAKAGEGSPSAVTLSLYCPIAVGVHVKLKVSFEFAGSWYTLYPRIAVSEVRRTKKGSGVELLPRLLTFTVRSVPPPPFSSSPSLLLSSTLFSSLGGGYGCEDLVKSPVNELVYLPCLCYYHLKLW
jgi:hypothetical protein